MIDSVAKGTKMKEARMLRMLLAAVVLGMIVTPIAVAGAKGHPAGKKPAQSSLKLLQGLKKEMAGITTEITSLHAKIGALEAPKQAPPSVPSGPAAGDLSGSYPNPKVRANSITSADVLDKTLTSADIAQNTIQSSDIEDGAISSADIANGSIGSVDLSHGSVGASQLVETHVLKAGSTFVGNGGTDEATGSCPAGERLLSGGGEWGAVNTNLTFDFSRPDPTNTNQWDVLGHNGTGTGTDFFVYVLCLKTE
jgi:hypothetical protein